MKFSILVPVYNVEKYLLECLESIDNQLYRDFEVVLVDDGSTDNSGKICDNYKLKHPNTVVIHKKNNGLISARRTGIQNAHGEYLIFCDSDDSLENKALEEIADVVERNNAELVIYNAHIWDGVKKTPFFEHVLDEGIVKNKKVIYDKFFLSYSLNSLCLKAVKRTIVDVNRNYERFYGCNFGEDLLQSVPLIKAANSIYYLDRCLYNYRTVSGMMRKYNPAYYWSYKKINSDIRDCLKNEEIPNFEAKVAFHLVVAAYGAVTQFKYCNSIDSKELDKIRKDVDFVNGYKLLENSKLIKRLSLKQKIIFSLFRKRMYRTLEFILKARKNG